MSRILLINPQRKHCSDIKFLLFLNGYQIEVCETIDEGINRFTIFEKLENSFDLVLIVADSAQLKELEQFKDNSFLAKAIVIPDPLETDNHITTPGDVATCRPELILNYVRTHLEKSDDNCSPLAKLKRFGVKNSCLQKLRS